MRYGLTKNIETFRPTTVAFHEWVAIWRDARAAEGWRDRLGYMFGGPGWKPEAAPAPRSRTEVLPAPGGGGAPPPTGTG